MLSGTGEGEDRSPRGRCIEQAEDEGAWRQPPLPTDEHTGKDIQSISTYNGQQLKSHEITNEKMKTKHDFTRLLHNSCDQQINRKIVRNAKTNLLHELFRFELRLFYPFLQGWLGCPMKISICLFQYHSWCAPRAIPCWHFHFLTYSRKYYISICRAH